MSTLSDLLAAESDPTLGTLTKTFTAAESSTITLTSTVLAPVVSVTKEVPQTGVTNNNWDAAENSYPLEDSAYATGLAILGYNTSNASYIQYTSVYAQEADPWSVTFSTDGTYMYVGGGDIQFYQYILSTPFDISTAVFIRQKTATANGVKAMVFSPDGTKLLQLSYVGRYVVQWSLSTAWNISTASNIGFYDVAPYETSPEGLAFNPDGTKMFVVGESGREVNQWSLSTPFVVTSGVTHQAVFSVSAEDLYPTGIAFNTDGTKMFICGRQGNDLNEYALTTGFDISTASFVGIAINLNTGTGESNVQDIYMTPLRLYMIGLANDRVYQYSLGISSVELESGSFSSEDVGKTITINEGELLLMSTSGSILVESALSSIDPAASGEWGMFSVFYDSAEDLFKVSGVGFDVSTASYTQSFSVAAQETNPRGIAFNTDGTKMFVVGGSGDGVNEYALSTGFDVSTASFTDAFSVAAQETNPYDVAFNTDGTKMYIVGVTGDDVNEYALSTGFDVSTASYTQSFSVAAQDTNPVAMAFNTDGTKMFILGYSGQDVNEYALTTGFDVSTASFTDAFSINPQDTQAFGMAFNTDGTKMFIVGKVGDDVNEYALTTGFDVSTASYTQSFSVAAQDTSPQGIAFNNNGTKMFILGSTGDDVNEYSSGATVTGYQILISTNIDTTYWTDINSTIATDSGTAYYAISTDDRTTWTVIDNTDGERDIARNNAGTWQYNSNATYGSETWTNATTNTELATIAEAMGTAQNQMDKAQLNALTDPNQITLANDLSLAVIMSNGVVFSTYSGTALNYDANVLNEGAILGTDYDFDAPAGDKARITALASNNLKVRVV